MTRFASAAHVISVVLSIAWHNGPVLMDWVDMSKGLHASYTQED